jgi:sulfotransferase family protein
MSRVSDDHTAMPRQKRYIAMWSGPRNISTAMMRAWGNRSDTFVCDEPLYAHYLLTTGHTDHPGYKETIRAYESDWTKVADWLTGPIPEAKPIFYQKHMAHHLQPGMGLDWIDRLTNCFLIRQPSETIASLAEFLPSFTVEETGLPQQVALFDRILEHSGAAPPVIDTCNVLTEPRGTLQELCKVVDVPFDEGMLNWPAGPRVTDGAWAPYWYQKVYQTTSFGAIRPRSGVIPEHLRHVLDDCQHLYERLRNHRIRPLIMASHN